MLFRIRCCARRHLVCASACLLSACCVNLQNPVLAIALQTTTSYHHPTQPKGTSFSPMGDPRILIVSFLIVSLSSFTLAVLRVYFGFFFLKKEGRKKIIKRCKPRVIHKFTRGKPQTHHRGHPKIRNLSLRISSRIFIMCKEISCIA